jgi:hypothetical protein
MKMSRRSAFLGAFLGATATGATALVLASAMPAMAASPTASAAPRAGHATCSAEQLAYVKARVDLHVAQRQLTIRQLTTALAARSHVTDAHRSVLSGLYVADAAGLTAVDATVQADSTCKQAVTDGHKVVTDYRVYMLLAPQTHLVAAADTGSFGASRLTAAEPKLQTGIDAITDPTRKAQAQAAYDDLVAQTKSASDDFSGVGDVVLALKPADMPQAQSTITAERSKVQGGRSALTTALKDAKTIAGLLI